MTLLFQIVGAALVVEGLRPGTLSSLVAKVQVAAAGGENRLELLQSLMGAHSAFLQALARLDSCLKSNEDISRFATGVAVVLGVAATVLSGSASVGRKAHQVASALGEIAAQPTGCGTIAAEAKGHLDKIFALEESLGYAQGSTTFKDIEAELWALKRLIQESETDYVG